MRAAKQPVLPVAYLGITISDAPDSLLDSRKRRKYFRRPALLDIHFPGDGPEIHIGKSHGFVDSFEGDFGNFGGMDYPRLSSDSQS